MAKPLYVYTGTDWVPVASELESTSTFATQTYADNAAATLGGLVHINSTTIGSGVSAVDVDNVFTSDYKSYRIILRAVTSGNANLTYRLRASGTPETGSVYIDQNIRVLTGTVSGATATNTSGFFISGGTTSHFATIDFYAPQLTENTFSISTYRSNSPATGLVSEIVNTSTAYDGISFSVSANTLSSGTIRIYGYKD